MAFQTGSSTSIENLMVQLSSFLVANGWTQDFFTSGEGGVIGFSKNSVSVAFKWTELQDNGVMAVYQNLINDNASSLWLCTGDSGGGEPSNTLTSLDTARCVNEFAGPHAGYWFFENDANPAYCHVVVEVDAGRFRHFGFGEMEKIADFTGGEYCYGHFWSQSTSFIDVPSSTQHDVGADAYNTIGVDYGATFRVENHVNEPNAATVWARCGCGSGNSSGNDRAGIPRWRAAGPWRYSREWNHFHAFRLSLLNAYKPLCPMPFEIQDWSSEPEIVWRMGYQADVRQVNIANLTAGQVINIAGDNWYFFPLVKKQFLSNDTEESWNAGIAYRRVDA